MRLNAPIIGGHPEGGFSPGGAAHLSPGREPWVTEKTQGFRPELRRVAPPELRPIATRRNGVTLIELLVVIGIITTLATMIVAIAPRFGERQRASRGAGQLQSWLNLAKQRALRDRRPVGIRIPYQANSSYVTELQYIEVPDESIGGTVTVPYPTAGTPNYSLVQLTTTAVISPGAANALLLPGDVILIPGRDTLHGKS